MIRAGVARCVITPPIGMPMMGYAAREGVAEGKDGELYCTALVFANGTARFAILAFDLIFILEPFVSRLREEIARRLGISASHVLLNCSHTHGGPPLQSSQYDFEDESQEKLLQGYVAGFEVQIVALAVQAAEQMLPARIATGVGEARIGINRREEQPDGSIYLGENPRGPIDHEVRVIRIDDLQGKPLAVIFAHGCHTVTMGPKSLRWSADYVGPARELVEHNLGCLSLFLQANGGDVNPIVGIGSNTDDCDAKTRLGLILGAEVLKVHSTLFTNSIRSQRTYIGSLAKIPFYPRIPIERELDSTIDVQEESLRLPLQKLPSLKRAKQILQECESTLAKLPDNATRGQLNVARRYKHWASELVNFVRSGREPVLEVPIQAVRIGDIGIIAVPGETFGVLGMQIKQQSPLPDTLALGYSNGCICYIPTRDAFPKEGWAIDARYAVPDLIFQAYLVPVALTPDCGELVVEKAVELLHNLDQRRLSKHVPVA